MRSQNVFFVSKKLIMALLGPGKCFFEGAQVEWLSQEVTDAQFERIYGISQGTVGRDDNGNHILAALSYFCNEAYPIHARQPQVRNYQINLVIPQLFQAFLRRIRGDNFVPTMFEKIAQGEEHGLFIFDQ